MLDLYQTTLRSDRESVWTVEWFRKDSREAISVLSQGSALGVYCDLGYLNFVSLL